MSNIDNSADDYLRRSRIPYLVLDETGIPIEWNAYAEALLSISGESPTGKGKLPSIRKLILERTHPGDTEKFDAFMAGEQDFFAYDFTRKNETEDASWYRMNVYRQEKNRFFALIDDITPQIIKETHLIEAKENAEKASLNRSQFLANISHEIRTPIQTIIGMGELLADTELDEEQTEYARQVQFSADVLLTLINDILDISKVEVGKLKIESIDFDPVDVIERTVDLVSMEAYKKGLEVNIDISSDIPAAIVGDPHRLQQVILNLVKNAVKFTESGEILLRAFPGTGDPERSSISRLDQILYVEVTDTGIGLEEAVMKKLFTDFFQADRSTTRKYGGTGLGLSISRNIVSLMGGKIGVSANDPRGSRFWFEIPLIPAETQPTPRKLLLSSQTRFLLVDDNPRTLDILTGMLAAHGYYQVSRADSGKQALSLMHLSNHAGAPFNILFIDMVMPDMDGWRLAAEINKDPEINHAQLYLMVPEGSFGAEAKMKLLDWFNGYLYKPIKRRLLYDLLRDHSQASLDLEVLEELEPVEDDVPIPEPYPNTAEPPDLASSVIIQPQKSKPESETVAKYQEDIAAGLTILVAEDHPVNRRLLVIFLEKAGATVIQAVDGQEAIEAMQVNDIDLIFMDIQMPRKNGYEAAAWIRKKGIKTPIIACTASAQENEREKCLACGMNEILPKPFKRIDVSKLLTRFAPKKDKKQEDPLVFNSTQFFDIMMGDTDAMASLAREYTAQTDEHLKILEIDLAENNISAIRATAHLIKGSSLSITANRVAEIAEEIELNPEGDIQIQVFRIHDAFISLKKRFTQEGYI
ncbi:MAG TPA: response regulator [Treponema sp.]|nr:response regulator [Treponema sp.]